MWIPLGVLLTLIALGLFTAWLGEAERALELAHALAVALAASTFGCDRRSTREARARAATGGDPRHGREVMRHYGCGSCHTIPGVAGANALVGPPLEKFGKRAYVAGVLPNSPPNLERWLMHPRGVLPTAMPEMGVTESDTREMAAYLYTLE